MNEFEYSSKMIYRVASIVLSLVMAIAWGGIFWMLDTGYALVAALIAFFVMLGLLACGEREIND